MTEAELRRAVRRVLVLSRREMGWRERKRQKDEVALMLIEAFKHGVSVYREKPPHGIERIARRDLIGPDQRTWPSTIVTPA